VTGSERARRVLVVGGQSRGVGKTALVEELLRAFPAAGWVAAKITPHEHRPGSIGAEGFALELEQDRSGRTDSSRLLVAGARRAFWLQTRPEGLARALAALWAELGDAENVVLEGNAVLELLEPTLYLAVLDPSRAGLKPSLAALLGRADAVVLRAALGQAGGAFPIQPGLLDRKPQFLQPFGLPLPVALLEFLRRRFFGRPPGVQSTAQSF
jgi:molybdopterin-guanine dinucleotide biosynthesis protein